MFCRCLFYFESDLSVIVCWLEIVIVKNILKLLISIVTDRRKEFSIGTLTTVVINDITIICLNILRIGEYISYILSCIFICKNCICYTFYIYVCRIDTNVEDTEMNIEAAHSEILKYFQSVTSNRWLMIKIFAVLIVFFIVFVVFMA